MDNDAEGGRLEGGNRRDRDRAFDGDEWDSDVEEWDMARTTSPQPGNIMTQGISDSSTMYNDPYEPHRARRESSTSTVNFIAPGQDYGLKALSPPPMDNRDNSGHPPSSFRYQIAGGEGEGQQHERNVSVDSAKTVVSPTVWPGGTKFKEGL